MRTLCYSVRLESLVKISPKAYIATAYDGSSAIIPISQVVCPDFDVCKSDAYWITAWILSKKSLQYSRKKEAWFDEKGKMLPSIERHIPERIATVTENIINDLIK